MASGMAMVLGVAVVPPEDITVAITTPHSWGGASDNVAIPAQFN